MPIAAGIIKQVGSFGLAHVPHPNSSPAWRKRRVIYDL
jgi:hypothetical protein